MTIHIMIYINYIIYNNIIYAYNYTWVLHDIDSTLYSIDNKILYCTAFASFIDWIIESLIVEVELIEWNEQMTIECHWLTSYSHCLGHWLTSKTNWYSLPSWPSEPHSPVVAVWIHASLSKLHSTVELGLRHSVCRGLAWTTTGGVER